MAGESVSLAFQTLSSAPLSHDFLPLAAWPASALVIGDFPFRFGHPLLVSLPPDERHVAELHRRSHPTPIQRTRPLAPFRLNDSVK
ncbi:hypothetical protein ACLOJK_013539 [Asimina triloba]